MVNIDLTFDKTDGSNILNINAAYDTNWVEGMTISEVILSDIENKKSLSLLAKVALVINDVETSLGHTPLGKITLLSDGKISLYDPLSQEDVDVYKWKYADNYDTYNFYTEINLDAIKAALAVGFPVKVYTQEQVDNCGGSIVALVVQDSDDKVSALTEVLNQQLINSGIISQENTLDYDDECLKSVTISVNLKLACNSGLLEDTKIWLITVKTEFNDTHGTSEAYAALPCKDTLSEYFKMAYDSSLDIATALSISNSLKDSCNIPKQYINALLKIMALQFAVDANDIDKTKELYDALEVKSTPPVIAKKPCGCYGRRFV